MTLPIDIVKPVTRPEDQVILSQLGVTARRVAERVYEVTQKAIENEKFYFAYPQLIEHTFEVQFPLGFSKIILACPYCSYEVTGPAEIRVMNVCTNRSLNFDKHMLHVLYQHLSFGESPFRIDPKEACEVFEIFPSFTKP